jgi:RNA-dependent RNA polymerase
MSFVGRLTPIQVVARHAYALTFQKTWVEQWEEQMMKGLLGNHGDEEDKKALRPR